MFICQYVIAFFLPHIPLPKGMRLPICNDRRIAWVFVIPPTFNRLRLYLIPLPFLSFFQSRMARPILRKYSPNLGLFTRLNFIPNNGSRTHSYSFMNSENGCSKDAIKVHIHFSRFFKQTKVKFVLFQIVPYITPHIFKSVLNSTDFGRGSTPSALWWFFFS